jgi:cytochrome c553
MRTRRKNGGEALPLPLAGRGALFLSALLALALAHPAQAQESDPGADLYFRHGCYGCHGFDGKSRMMMLDAETSGILRDEATFIAFLRMRADQNPMLPSTRMPNYPESALPDEDARAIYAHILAIQAPDPAAEEIPVLKSILDEAASE